MAAISKALKKGDTVTLVGFGTFAVKKRAARDKFKDCGLPKEDVVWYAEHGGGDDIAIALIFRCEEFNRMSGDARVRFKSEYDEFLYQEFRNYLLSSD